MDKESKINWSEAARFFKTLLSEEKKNICNSKSWLKTINKNKWKEIEDDIKG